LGAALKQRFAHDPQPETLDDAVEAFAQAVERTPSGSPDEVTFRGDLGVAFGLRHAALDRHGDLDRAIEHLEASVVRGLPDHSSVGNYATALGLALRERFERTHRDSDARDAVAAFRHALDATPANGPERLQLLEHFHSAADTVEQASEEGSEADEPWLGLLHIFVQARTADELAWLIERERERVTPDFVQKVTRGASGLEDRRTATGLLSIAIAASDFLGDPRLCAKTRGEYGRALADMGAFEKAIEYYTMAVNGLEAAGERSEAAYYLSRAGLAYEDSGELERAYEAFEESGHAFAELGDVRGCVLQVGSAAIVKEKLGEVETAIDLYTRARDESRDAGILDVQAQNELRGGGCLLEVGRAGDARERLAEAADLYRELGDDDLFASSLLQLGRADAQLGDTTAARHNLEQAHVVAEEAGSWERALDAIRELAELELDMGDIAAADDRRRTGVELVASLGDPSLVGAELFDIGRRWHVAGELERSAEAFREARRAYHEAQDVDGEATAVYNVAATDVAAGDWAAALDRGEEAADLYAQAGSEENLSKALYLVAVCRARLDVPDAREALERAAERLRALNPGIAALALQELAQLARASGSGERADAALAEAVSLAHDAAQPTIEAFVLREQALSSADPHVRAPLLEQASAVAEQGGSPSLNAVVAIELAEAYEELGDRRRASAEAKKAAAALAARSQVHELDSSVALMLSAGSVDESIVPRIASLARLQFELGRPDDAIALLRSGLQWIGDRNVRGQVVLASVVAVLEADKQGAARSGLAAAERALALSHGAGDLLGEVLALWAVAQLRRKVGQLDAAVRDAERAVSLSKELGEVVGECMANQDLAICYRAVGRLEDALEAALHASELARDLDAPAVLASALSTLILVHTDRSEWQAAIDLGRETSRLLGSTGDDVLRSGVLTNVGNAYVGMGHYPRALELHREALELAKTAGDPGRVAGALANIANVFRILDQLDEAAEFTERALEIEESLDDPRGAAISLGNIGAIRMQQGRTAQARTAIDEALARFRRIGHSRGEADQLSNLGWLVLQEGEPRLALDYQNRAIALLEGLHDADFSMRLHLARSFTWEELDRPDEAFRDCERAVADAELVRRQLLLPAHRLVYGARDAFMAHARLIDLAERRRDAAGAWLTVERAKARVLAEQLGYGDWPRPPLVDARLLDDERVLLSETAATEAALEAPSTAGERDAAEARLAELHSRLERCWSAIADVAPEYVSLRRGSPLQEQDLLGLVEPQREAAESALLELFTTEEAVFVLTLRSGWDEPRIRRVALSLHELESNHAQSFQSDVVGFPRRRAARIPATKRWHELGPRLLGDALAEVGHVDLLYLMPHGPLHAMALHALPVDSVPLIEQVPVVYAPSVGVLQRLHHRGNDVARGGVAQVLAYTSDDLERELFNGEAQRVAELLGVEARVDDAARSAILTTAAARAPFVHLSCHGVFDADDPLSSGIELADGRLTARRIMSLRFGADLITISACDSALGGRLAGDELLGLLRALLFAGARSALASLWAVAADSTLALMEAFYARLLAPDGRKRMPEARALQLAILEIKQIPGWEDPYFWAPFILVGDWR
jgi:tetratricopeptide (TPR) repeat protein